tara:strand:- start:331 stop:645 length:315 start_codon:yes stop_codon:yes gene_type:complete
MMTQLSLTNALASTLGISGFMVALCAGAVSGNSIDGVLERVLLSSLLCFLAGGALGMLLDGVLERHAQKLRAESVPDDGQGPKEAPNDPTAPNVEQVSSPQVIA